jgi:Ni2+-binding GTPase involved in maturation of urease and hydrogenase
MNNEGTFIGLNGNRKVYTADNAKHIFICGTTGSGKTVALANYIKRANDCNYPLLLADGKGDIGEGGMLDIV